MQISVISRGLHQTNTCVTIIAGQVFVLFGIKRKKREHVPSGHIRAMTVNGVAARCLNARIFYDKEGTGKLEIYTKEPTESFHFDRSDFEFLTTDNKKLVITASFDSAVKEGKLYHYLFTIQKYNEYFA